MLRLDHVPTPALLACVLLASACADDPRDPMAADEGSTAVGGSTGEDDPAGEDDPGRSSESTGDDLETTHGSTSDGAADDSTGPGLDLDALYGCEETNFQVIQPLSGPGIDPETGALLEPMQSSYLLHTTQILVIPEQLDAFLALNGPIFEQLAQTEGLLGFSLAFEPNCGFSRTMGVWRDAQSMYAFVGSGAHAVAMSKTTEVSLTGRTTSWTVAAEELPLTWEMAMAALSDVEPSPVYD